MPATGLNGLLKTTKPCFELSYKSKELDPYNELFLTLIKLRQAKDDYALALDLGISRSVVGKDVNTWINFMYFQLSELDFWPARQVVDEHFPIRFQNMFPITRLILGATEVQIHRPKHCDGQRQTFSTYKNMNMNISPRGVVSYVSDSYEGSSSDRLRSALVKDDMLSSGDSIMADRGIMVQDFSPSRDIHVKTPTTMKGRTLDTHQLIDIN